MAAGTLLSSPASSSDLDGEGGASMAVRSSLGSSRWRLSSSSFSPIQQSVIDAHSHKEDHAGDYQDDATGDVGVVIVLIVVIESTWRWRRDRDTTQF